jgi:hypothetical protein
LHFIRRSRLTVVALALAVGLGLTGCTLPDLSAISEEAAFTQAAVYLEDSQSCLAERVDNYPTGEDLVAFASGLGPCVNVYILGKTDQELDEGLRPSGSGTYLAEAIAEGETSATLAFVTVGVGNVVAGAWSERHTILVCWHVPVDLEGREVGQPSGIDCTSRVTSLWPGSEVVTLEDLQSESK